MWQNWGKSMATLWPQNGPCGRIRRKSANTTGHAHARLPDLQHGTAAGAVVSASAGGKEEASRREGRPPGCTQTVEHVLAELMVWVIRGGFQFVDGSLHRVHRANRSLMAATPSASDEAHRGQQAENSI